MRVLVGDERVRCVYVRVRFVYTWGEFVVGCVRCMCVLNVRIRF